MKGTFALCWSLLLLLSLLTHSVVAKGGRGGARGGARGSSLGGSRLRSKTSKRYGSFRVAAGAAAGGAAAGAASRFAGRRRWNYDSSEVDTQGGNRTYNGYYSYRAWTSGGCNIPKCLPLTLASCATAFLRFYV